MEPKPPNICDECPLWATVEPKLSKLMRVRRNIDEERLYLGAIVTVTRVDIKAGELNCKDREKAIPDQPDLDEVWESMEPVNYIAACLSFAELKVEDLVVRAARAEEPAE